MSALLTTSMISMGKIISDLDRAGLRREIGIIIGGASATGVKSMMDNIFMPVPGSLAGGINFADKNINLSDERADSFAAAKEAGLPVIGYGQFIQDAIAFVILARVPYIRDFVDSRVPM